MFYKFVKKQWEADLVSVGLPAFDEVSSSEMKASDVTLLALGITALAILFLSNNEKLSIAKLEKESAHDFAKKRYFKEPTSYGNQTQYDVDRIIIRASKGDYSEGAVLHMLELSAGLIEADFVSENINTAKANFKRYKLSTGS